VLLSPAGVLQPPAAARASAEAVVRRPFTAVSAQLCHGSGGTGANKQAAAAGAAQQDEVALARLLVSDVGLVEG
jgi:hypothetical protein